MRDFVQARISGDEKIHINGQLLREKHEIVTVLQKIFDLNPEIILVVNPEKEEYFRGIGKVIYASQFVGISSENLRYSMANGETVTFDELHSRTPPCIL